MQNYYIPVTSSCKEYNLAARRSSMAAPAPNPQTQTPCSCGKDFCALDNVPKVDIDPDGVFKYILIKVFEKEKENEVFTTILRGYMRCNYHTDIFHEVQEKLKPLCLEPLGGGKIAHQANEKKIHIYGYSQGYGQADHVLAAQLVKEAYPFYTITISETGPK